MNELVPGLEIDPNTLIMVQQNTIAQQAVRIAQLEAGVQQSLAENQRLTLTVAAMSGVEEEVRLASTDN